MSDLAVANLGIENHGVESCGLRRPASLLQLVTPLLKLLPVYHLPGCFLQRMESCLIGQRRSILGFKVMRSGLASRSLLCSASIEVIVEALLIVYLPG